mgnify:CR=1 FL=1
MSFKKEHINKSVEHEIFGYNTAKNMIKIDAENYDYIIHGYISNLNISKSNRNINYQYDKRKKEPRVQVYYAHPYRSGERGSNENANRLIRRFIPKGTVITNISEEYIQEIEDWINNLLRPMFGYKSSLEMARNVS